MNFCRQSFGHARVLATLTSVGLACAALAGDAIRFSKPAVAFAAPPKPESDLPEVRERGLDFSNPNFDAPAASPPPRTPPPMMRSEPRDLERERTHPLLRTPAMFTDPDEEKARKEALRDAENHPFKSATQKSRPGSSSMKDLDSPFRSDPARSLAPVTDLDWKPGDAANGRKEARRGGSGGQSYAQREDEDFSPPGMRASTPFEFNANRASEKLTPAQLQRRTDFEQLLNPNAGAAGRAPNSLQPVVNAAAAKASSLATPTVGGSGYDPRASDPTTLFNRQQDRLRGPIIEDVNKRYNATPANGAASPGYGNPSQGPTRQPLTREFPGRKF